MTDIVERLRDRAASGYPMHGRRSIFTEAADEIERLRAEIERLRAAVAGIARAALAGEAASSRPVAVKALTPEVMEAVEKTREDLGEGANYPYIRTMLRYFAALSGESAP